MDIINNVAQAIEGEGCIEVESEVGKGTTMRIVLPVDLQEPVAERTY